MGLNEFSFKGHGYIYTDKPIFNHGELRIQDRQWLNPETAILLRYRYVPNLFLGPNFERRRSSRLITDEWITSHTGRTKNHETPPPHPAVLCSAQLSTIQATEEERSNPPGSDRARYFSNPLPIQRHVWRAYCDMLAF